MSGLALLIDTYINDHKPQKGGFSDFFAILGCAKMA